MPIKSTLPISIVIPTLNEENYLPKLLISIKQQSKQPAEIIVADAFSKDDTRKIAKLFGAKIVDGGHPGAARNNGARFATQKYIYFFDADVILPKMFLEETLAELQARKLQIASCPVTPLSPLFVDKLIHFVWNFYFDLTRGIFPHVIGFCMLVERDLHNKIGGFNEGIVVGEDMEYGRRAAKLGTFEYLSSNYIPVSVRRFVKTGRTKMVFKYLTIELYTIFFGDPKKDFFNYDLSNNIIFDPAVKISRHRYNPTRFVKNAAKFLIN